MDEKRKFSRVPFSATTVLIADKESWECQLIDISVKGALIELPPDCTLNKGKKVNLELRLNESDVVIKMDLVVAHITDSHAGCFCEQIDAVSMTHLRRLIELNLGDPDALYRELAQLGKLT